jgi:hypothetical protein
LLAWLLGDSTQNGFACCPGCCLQVTAIADAIDQQLGKIHLAPAALAAILPSVQHSYSKPAAPWLLQQAAGMIADISEQEAFLAWPAAVLVQVVEEGPPPAHAVSAMHKWAQHDRDARSTAWAEQLLPVARWDLLTAADMQKLRNQVDDEQLRLRLFDALLERQVWHETPV